MTKQHYLKPTLEYGYFHFHYNLETNFIKKKKVLHEALGFLDRIQFNSSSL